MNDSGLEHLTLALASAAAVLLASAGARAQTCTSPDPAWVFCEDFEGPEAQNGNLGKWDDQGLTPSNLVVTSDPQLAHTGGRSLEITAHKGADTGGGPTKWFLPGVDVVHVRFWVRFDAEYNHPHHMVFIGASEASNKWSAFGTAGCRPSGSNFFTTSMEPFGGGSAPAPGAWGMYTYSVDMQCDPGSSCANYANPQQICDDCATKGSPCNGGLECCWGANNISSPRVTTALGTWACLEARVEANTGGQKNGSQTLWVDGAQVGQWGGIQFRTDDALKINSLGLWHYVTDDVYAPGDDAQTVWFDDVVISTAPIGCGEGGPATGAGGSGSGSGPGGPGAGGGSTGPSAGPSGAGAGNNADGSGDETSSCACRAGGGPGPTGALLAIFAAAVALGARTQRSRRNRGWVT